MGCGFGVAGGAVAHLAAGWPLATVLGGLLVAAAGGLTLARGRDWPGMGARYDRPSGSARPGSARPETEAALWDALDRGDDPTAR
jgi:uncharacterized membrane protein (TIGR02234 family)